MAPLPATMTAESEAHRAGATEIPVVRWVFPQPPPPPTWLEGSKTTFGRDASCTVCLEGDTVSRQHAALVRSGPLVIVSDLGSKNGVAVNGRPTREEVVSPGDVIRFGNFVGVLLLAPAGTDLSSATLGPGVYGGFRLRQAFERMRTLAPTDLALVLEGETGTGKETFARAAHALSGRTGPFRAVNCAVYSKSMAAAELFGYRKGAFTGADAASIGHVRAAEGGTLLLDELTELAPDVQTMLLRVLENREVQALGESKPVPINVRFVAATQIALDAAVESGVLRADLRARLEGGVIALPALRESREVLVEMFLALYERHTGTRPALLASFAERLSLHAFPLNIRELDTLARRVAAHNPGGRALDRDALDSALDARLAAQPAAPAPASGARRSKPPLYAPEDLAALNTALERARGNLTEAAAALGLSRSKAYRMLQAAGARPARKP